MKKFNLIITTLMLVFSSAYATTPFKTTSWHTKTGALVIFYQAMEVPILDITIAFAAGSAYDLQDFGLSTLTLKLLNQGNNGEDSTTIAEKLADTGAQYEAINNQDMVVLNLKTLTDDKPLNESIKIYKDIITRPDFREDAFMQEKSQQLMAIKQTLESPEAIANQAFFQMLYKNHPYAHPVIGNHDSVNNLTVEKVKNFYHKYFVSKNAIIVLVGAINEQTAKKISENLTKDLPEGKKAEKIPLANELSEEMDIEVPFKASQTVIYLGQLAITHHDPNYFPLLVGNYILGGGSSLDSQLSKELREKRGLTYGVSSQIALMKANGPFIISFSTKSTNTKEALDVARKTLTKFINNGATEEELIAAKQYLTGSFPLSLASNRNIAYMLLKIAFYQMPDDFITTYIEKINAVTLKEIKLALERLIKPNKLLQVSVGKNGNKS